MGELGRAKERVFDLPGIECTPELGDALSALYALGFEHGESEVEVKGVKGLASLRLLARRATEFVSEGSDSDVTYPALLEALDAWWKFGS